MDDDIKASIKREEGLRLESYPDSRGLLTIGYGHLLVHGSTIPIEAAELIFEADYALAVNGYDSLALTLDSARRGAVIDMIFNMGIAGVKKFKRFLLYLKAANWHAAASELMDSAYAGQVPNRAKRNRDKILYGSEPS